MDHVAKSFHHHDDHQDASRSFRYQRLIRAIRELSLSHVLLRHIFKNGDVLSSQHCTAPASKVTGVRSSPVVCGGQFTRWSVYEVVSLQGGQFTTTCNKILSQKQFQKGFLLVRMEMSNEIHSRFSLSHWSNLCYPLSTSVPSVLKFRR